MQRDDKRTRDGSALRAATPEKLRQHGFHAREIGYPCPDIIQPVARNLRRLAAVCSVFEPEELRDLVQRETNPLRGLHELHPGDIVLAVAANASTGPASLANAPMVISAGRSGMILTPYLSTEVD